MLPFVLTDLIDRADMGMVKRSCGARFAQEALERPLVRCEFFRQKLQGDLAPQDQVFSAIHHSHATATQLFDYTVMGDRRAQHGASPSEGKLGEW